MASEAAQAQAPAWLLENGPRELESLFRAVVFHPSTPILIADNERNYRDASAGAEKLLRISRNEIIGQKMEDLADLGFRPRISELWRTFLGKGQQTGTLRLAGPDGTPRDVEYVAKGNVLPLRHLLVLREKVNPELAEDFTEAGAGKDRIPSWVEDYALFLLNANGCVAGWYAGAARIYGYDAEEITGEHVSVLYPTGENRRAEPSRNWTGPPPKVISEMKAGTSKRMGRHSGPTRSRWP